MSRPRRRARELSEPPAAPETPLSPYSDTRDRSETQEPTIHLSSYHAHSQYLATAAEPTTNHSSPVSLPRSASAFPSSKGLMTSGRPTRSPAELLDQSSSTPQLPSPASTSGTIADVGIAHFMENFVVSGSGPSPGFCDYAIAAYNDRRTDDCAIYAAVQAVGLAALANKSGGVVYAREAQAQYGNALTKINAALLDPGEANRDSTVLAIIVLGLYETITCVDDESIAAWSKHVDGAANLLVHRGTSQFETSIGLEIFKVAVAHLLVSYSRLQLPLPPRIRLLRMEASRLIKATDPLWALCSAHIEVLDLNSQVDPDRKDPFLEKDWARFLLRALELDGRIEGYFANLDTKWQYKIVIDPSAEPSMVFRGKLHIYHDIWVAKVWNGMRSCRMILNDIIRALLDRECSTWNAKEAGPGGTYAGLYEKSIATMRTLRDDLLASAPQMLGHVYHEATTSTTIFNYKCTTKPPSGAALGAFFIQWHLYLAGTLPFNSPETKAWIIDRLHHIRVTTGMKKAQYLAERLEKDALFSSDVQ